VEMRAIIQEWGKRFQSYRATRAYEHINDKLDFNLTNDLEMIIFVRCEHHQVVIEKP